MCGKCQNRAAVGIDPLFYGRYFHGKYEPNWANIPPKYNEIRRTPNGNLFATSPDEPEGRLCVRVGPDKSNPPVGYVATRGSTNGTVANWPVIATRPVEEEPRQYFAVRPGYEPEFLGYKTRAQVEMYMAEAKPDVYLCEYREVARNKQTVTTTTEWI